MLENDEDSEDGEDGSPSWWNKAVQDGVSQAAIDRVLGEDPEGETPEEFTFYYCSYKFVGTHPGR